MSGLDEPLFMEPIPIKSSSWKVNRLTAFWSQPPDVRQGTATFLISGDLVRLENVSAHNYDTQQEEE